MTNEERRTWSEEVDRIAKEMKPTRNGIITPFHFMEAVELTFQSNGWDFKAWKEAAMMTSAGNHRNV